MKIFGELWIYSLKKRENFLRAITSSAVRFKEFYGPFIKYNFSPNYAILKSRKDISPSIKAAGFESSSWFMI